MSQLMKLQTKTFRTDYYVATRPETLIATVRYDDECGNGHNTFAITGEIYRPYRQSGELHIKHKDGQTLWLNGGGCCHDTIREYLPELAKYIKWHLCSSDGPLHYIANTVHLAGDRDCWGLRKGEIQQSKKSGPSKWCLDLDNLPGNMILSETEPPPITIRWKPYGRIGEGKERELAAARVAAIWPEATNENLTDPGLKERLEARLPTLLTEFRKAVEELGFTY